MESSSMITLNKEGELEKILNYTPFLLTRCGRDLRYLYVSKAYATMIGRTPDQVAGKPIIEIMGPQGFETIRPYVETVLQGSGSNTKPKSTSPMWDYAICTSITYQIGMNRI